MELYRFLYRIDILICKVVIILLYPLQAEDCETKYIFTTFITAKPCINFKKYAISTYNRILKAA